MNTSVANKRLATPGPARLTSWAQKRPALLKPLVEGLNSNKARTRFNSAKALRLIAQERPELLYPFFDDFVRLLDHPNKVLQWEGSIVLSFLVAVDTEKRFDTIFKRFFRPIAGPVMITAANIISGSARIAHARPELAQRIASELLKVRNANYATPECRNVAIGHAITAFEDIFDLLTEKDPVLELVQEELNNSRPATRRKAQRLLAKLHKPRPKRTELKVG